MSQAVGALPLALSMGDPAGVGPELIASAWAEALQHAGPCWVAGNAELMQAALDKAPGTLQLRCFNRPQHVREALNQGQHPDPATLWLVTTPADCTAIRPGQVSAAAGLASLHALEVATDACLRGQARALVTAPIHKMAWQAAGVAYPGHTEWLQQRAAMHLGCTTEQLPVRMMLANNELQVVLLSVHTSLRQALDLVTCARVLDALVDMQRHLQGRAPGAAPRLAVAGLNPHAGEGGQFGNEEQQHIAPAVAAARAQGVDVVGPLSPDTVFWRARQGEFDAVLAMYHDQGLIPIKYGGFDHGVNVTLGLPFVRASPDHGTAFDLVGTGLAKATSLMAAIRWAANRG